MVCLLILMLQLDRRTLQQEAPAARNACESPVLTKMPTFTLFIKFHRTKFKLAPTWIVIPSCNPFDLELGNPCESWMERLLQSSPSWSSLCQYCLCLSPSDSGDLLVQMPRVGRPSPATILASLASYGFLDASGHAEVLHGICALAQAAALSTRMSFAGFLAHACGKHSHHHQACA